ncbi:MAG: hypothetical protein K2H20_01775 [Bacilli bacterium]|nr:hypothetical protein [Bacilli bacterium]
MKTFNNNILKAIKNVNRFYLLGAFWSLWMFYITPIFVGDFKLFIFFIGYCISLVIGAYICDNLNVKEQKFAEKITNWLKENVTED